MTQLEERLDEIARSPVLLVASDYDGTIAPIVSDPSAAEADREALVALRVLTEMPQTHVAIISGRALQDLAQRTKEAENVHLVGSHGSEFEAGFPAPLPEESQALLLRLKTALSSVASATPGLLLEEKPASFALHYRNAGEAAGAAAVDAVLRGPAAWPGVQLRPGKMVIELGVVHTNKGLALEKLRQRLGATAVIYLGDDLTDEDAFATLKGPDVGIKVGPGETRARDRAGDRVIVARMLARLAERRAEWLAGSEATPIQEHALLSDQRTVALVDPCGRVVWMCLPRIDSAAVFAELLGGPRAGYFEIRPPEEVRPVEQAYVGDTFLLRTRWRSLTVTDYLDCSGARAFQRAGRTDFIRVIEGRGRVRIAFAPRLDFGRMETRLRVSDLGVEVEGSIDPLVLRAPSLKWEIVSDGQNQTAVCEVEVGDQPIVLEMRFGTASLSPEGLPEPERRRRVEHFWSAWSATLSIPKVASGLVRRSALVLKALCYGPTGAFAAAATSSLPEHAGGVRNWDYRFCWPRDAALSAAALLRLGASGPAIRFLDWVLGILDQSPPASLLAPVYTMTGGHLGAEAEIAELCGYRGSRPVRIGNAAAQQVQLDVFGPIADLVALLASHGAALSSEHWRLVASMVNAVEKRWEEPDHGIWEVRRPRQHHVHSKIMCWQTVDRALAVAAYMGRSRPDWVELRNRIAENIFTHAWQAQYGSLCATYDACEADAAALTAGLSGLLAAGDPRLASTVEFVERQLRVGPTVYRYRYDDGLPGIEGGFHLCTCWLIEAYAMVGRRDAAAELFERFVSLAGPTGLFSEQFDPEAGQALGNFPQAFSHLGLVNAALRLSDGG